MGNYYTVTTVDQVAPGTRRVVRLRGKRIAVSQVEGSFYAIDDVCTHDDGPLGEGTLKGDEVECPRHGARFNVRTGAALTMPAVVPVKAYRVRVDGTHLQVELP